MFNIAIPREVMNNRRVQELLRNAQVAGAFGPGRPGDSWNGNGARRSTKLKQLQAAIVDAMARIRPDVARVAPQLKRMIWNGAVNMFPDPGDAWNGKQYRRMTSINQFIQAGGQIG